MTRRLETAILLGGLRSVSETLGFQSPGSVAAVNPHAWKFVGAGRQAGLSPFNTLKLLKLHAGHGTRTLAATRSAGPEQRRSNRATLACDHRLRGCTYAAVGGRGLRTRGGFGRTRCGPRHLVEVE